MTLLTSAAAVVEASRGTRTTLAILAAAVILLVVGRRKSAPVRVVGILVAVGMVLYILWTALRPLAAALGNRS
jgi:hypothetical protein